MRRRYWRFWFTINDEGNQVLKARWWWLIIAAVFVTLAILHQTTYLLPWDHDPLEPRTYTFTEDQCSTQDIPRDEINQPPSHPYILGAYTITCEDTEYIYESMPEDQYDGQEP
jgi:hypothetical protein